MTVLSCTSTINTTCFLQDRQPQEGALSIRKVTHLQLAGRIIYHSFMRLVSLIASIACRLLSLHVSKTYYEMKRDYHHGIIRYSLHANRTFGKNLISFSFNGVPNPQKYYTSEEGDINLKKRYGQDLERYIETINSSADLLCRINTRKLSLPNIGICCGMSLDFVAQVLHRSDVNETEIAAIQRIANGYEQGSTPRAEIFQRLTNARDFKEFNEHVEQLNVKLKTKYLTLSEAEKEAHLQEIPNIERKLNELLYFEHFKIILNIDFHLENFSGFANVKPGIYLILSQNVTAPNHMMAYFRLKDVGILFDSNRGCCLLSNQADYKKFEEDIILGFCSDRTSFKIARCSVVKKP